MSTAMEQRAQSASSLASSHVISTPAHTCFFPFFSLQVLIGVVDKYCYGAAGAVSILTRELAINAREMHDAMSGACVCLCLCV